jgi:uncharacterized radical SAM superfamily protein
MSNASSDKAQLINAHTGLRGIAAMNVFIAHIALMDLFGNSSIIKSIIPVYPESSCKPVEQEENHENGPRWSWARNRMGNPE